MLGVVSTLLAPLPGPQLALPGLQLALNVSAYRGGTCKNTGEEYRGGARRPTPSYFIHQGHWRDLMPIITRIRAEMVDSQLDSCMALHARLVWNEY